MEGSFYDGLFWGFFVAGIVGWIFRKIQTALRNSKKHKKPLNSFPASAQANMTSSGVVRESLLARIGCLFWTIILIWTLSIGTLTKVG
jgi:hypothetical protein